MIYFDSAATSFQKPASVAAAMWEALASMSGGDILLRRGPPTRLSSAARSWRSCLG